jgi:hypothetical protein
MRVGSSVFVFTTAAIACILAVLMSRRSLFGNTTPNPAMVEGRFRRAARAAYFCAVGD